MIPLNDTKSKHVLESHKKATRLQQSKKTGVNIIPRQFADHAKYIKELGAALLGVGFTGRGHIKMRVAYGGNCRFFILSKTPSDHRAFLNWQSDIRKWLTQTGKKTTDDHGSSSYLPCTLRLL